MMLPDDSRQPADEASEAQPPKGHPPINAAGGDVSRCPFVRGFDAALAAFLGGEAYANPAPTAGTQPPTPPHDARPPRARDNIS